jgi:serine/threonine protein kinase
MKPIEPTTIKPSPVKILIVDDDFENGALVSCLLDAAGYDVEHVLSPVKAIPLIRDGEFALALLDQNMPGMDGLTLLAEIRKESNVPVVMLTAADKSSLAVQALKLGAFDYLTKPVDEKRLIETVRQALGSMSGPGVRIANYEIDRELGRGGMGVVYAARDPRLDRTVALKVLLPEFAADPSFEMQFLGEARSAAKFSHPNIVTVYEAGRFRGRLFMAMEFVKGEPLENYVRAGTPVPPAKVLDIAHQVTTAIEVMHAAGMHHSDIKPANLMMTGGSTVKILDFGLARPATGPIDPAEKDREGDCSGTLAYTPPEMFIQGRSDGRGDIYSLGVVLYELLVGKRAFAAKSMADIMFQIVESRPSTPFAEIAGVPPEMIELVRRMMAVEPDARPAGIAEVRSGLQALRRVTGDRRSGR